MWMFWHQPLTHGLGNYDDVKKMAVKEEIKRKMTALDPSPPARESPRVSSRKSALDVLLGPEEVSDDFPTCEEELDAYFAEKPVSREVNPLKWWKENSGRFVRLAKVSRSLLSIPATSAPAERR